MSGGGLWVVTKELVKERQLLSFGINDWMRHRTSTKFLAGALFIELLFAGTFAYYTFEDVGVNDSCYG